MPLLIVIIIIFFPIRALSLDIQSREMPSHIQINAIGSMEICIVPGEDCAAVAVGVIEHARARIWLLGYGFSNEEILDALIAAKDRGVDVRVVLDHSNETSRSSGGRGSASPHSGAAMVDRAGIPTLIDHSVKIMHHKVMVVDEDQVVLGSFNWTDSANRRNAENLNVFRGNPALAHYYAQVFLQRAEAAQAYRAAP